MSRCFEHSLHIACNVVAWAASLQERHPMHGVCGERIGSPSDPVRPTRLVNVLRDGMLWHAMAGHGVPCLGMPWHAIPMDIRSQGLAELG